MLQKIIILLFFTLNSLICFSQNHLAYALKKYDNCFYGKVVKETMFEILERRKGCIGKDTLKVEIINKIKGDYTFKKKEIKIPYESYTHNCMYTPGGRIFDEKKKYLFFFNDFKSIEGNTDFSYYEIKSENEKKHLKLVNDYLTVNSKSETVDWTLNYANDISYKNGLIELFQYRHKGYKWSYLICNNHICNCENSYSLNIKQLEKLKEIYIRQEFFSVFDICVLTELNEYSNEELFKATKKRFENINDKSISSINKPFIQCTTKFSNDPKLIEISKKIDAFKYQDYKNGYKAFKLLVKEYIEQYTK